MKLNLRSLKTLKILYLLLMLLPFNLKAQWSEIDVTDTISYELYMKTDRVGNLYVANYYRDDNGFYQIRKWVGDKWVQLPSTNYFYKGISKIEFDSKGNLYAVGWFTNTTGNSNGDVFVAKWDGQNWSKCSNRAN